MERQLERLAGHIVVVGYRSLGQRVSAQLRDVGETVLVLVVDASLADRAAANGNLVILGAADVFDDALRRARLDSAKALIATSPDGDANLAITLLAKSLNRSLPIIVPGDNTLRKTLLENAGATDVVIGDDILANALIGKLGAHVESVS